MSDPSLFRRVANVTVGSTNITGLDVAFKVKKTLKKEPNDATISIYNLSDTTRKSIEAATPTDTKTVVPVIISAGYVDAVSTIFSGELRGAQTSRQGADKVTTLSSGDGDHAIAQTRLNVSLGSGTSAAQGLKVILKALGVGQGNLAKAVNLVQQNAALGQMFTQGCWLNGCASDVMTDFCRSAGLEWSVQDGNFQALALGQPLAGQSILIDSAHGMEDSPSVDTKGVLSFKCRMIPGIKPGVVVSMNGLYVKGGYRVISCEYSGHTRSSEWSISVEGSRY